ncbi:MAG: FapA family protein [Planctomycetes bacterium]|nr:FapA family protein [Planctomycetota bacterium]
MSSTVDTAILPVFVEVSTDKMQAWLKRRKLDEANPPTSQDILAAVKEAAIALTDDVKRRVEEYLGLITAEELPPDPFLLAEGTPPLDGKNEELVWDESYQAEARHWQDDAQVNYYTMNAITTVGQDAVIGTLKPLVPARDGVDVRGERVSAKGTPRSLEIGSTIRRAADGSGQIIACLPGRVVEENCKLFINEVLVITGDVSFATGNVYSTTDVNIAGSIPDRFEVKSAKSITVRTAIEAALVEAKGDINVRCGIVGRHSGRVRAGGEIVARFCSEANLAAEGNIKIGVQLMGSLVRTNGMLIGERAAIIGGYVYARNGLAVATLGSKGAVSTRVFVGVSPVALQEAARIDAQIQPTREAARKTQERFHPLTLSDNIMRRDKILEVGGANANARISVSGTIYPRTTISIGTRVVMFNEELKGPIYIEERKVKNATELVSVNALSGSITTLPSQMFSAGEILQQYEPLLDTPLPPSDSSERPPSP